MMIRLSSGLFLEFNGDIEIERQVKLFEKLDETWGDFSYTFELPLTQNNLSALGLPFPDNKNKLVFQKVEADILTDGGEVLYRGYLRIERISNVIETSFFSGNNNWMSLLSDPMTTLRLSHYDQVQTEANIVARFSETDGIVFPLMDTGALVTRSYRNTKPEDFLGCFYVKTLMQEIFLQSGLKLDGELVNDPFYNKMIVGCNTRSKVEVDRNSIYVGLNAAQALGAAFDSAPIDFNLQTNPYFIGESVSFVGDSAYVASTDMIVDAEASMTATGTLVLSFLISSGAGYPGGAGTQVSISAKNIKLAAGQNISVIATNILGGAKTITSASFKVTPRFIYKAFGSSSVPQWSRVEFVSAILDLFNTVTDYDPATKTVTANFMGKIKSKPALDLSEYVQVTEVDYSEFVSSYGKRTTLGYEESSDEDLRDYNIMTFNRYGDGVLNVDNDFLPDSAELLRSDFTAPISYIQPKFDFSMERVPFVELEENGDEQEITSVTDSSDIPRFMITDADDFFEVNDLIRLDTTNLEYNGEWVIDAVTSTYITVRGLLFDIDATGSAIKLIHNLTSDDAVYLFVNTGERAVSHFSKNYSGIYINDTEYNDASLAFFNLIHNNTAVNTDFKQSLSFGEIVDPLFYQRTMIEAYWKVVEEILNDPVMMMLIGHLPEHIHRQLTPLAPVYIKTLESTNLYYINNESGYKGSSRPCELKLIKLP
jgi:hypothetical protein